jgi:hypothetical protein
LFLTYDLSNSTNVLYEEPLTQVVTRGVVASVPDAEYTRMLSDMRQMMNESKKSTRGEQYVFLMRLMERMDRVIADELPMDTAEDIIQVWVSVV